MKKIFIDGHFLLETNSEFMPRIGQYAYIKGIDCKCQAICLDTFFFKTVPESEIFK